MKKRVDSFQDIFFAYMPIELVDKLYACLEGKGFPCGSVGKESTCSVGDLGSIPGLGRSPGEGKGYPLQYSGLENSMDSPWSPKELDMTE